MNQDYGSYVTSNQWQPVFNRMGWRRVGGPRSILLLYLIWSYFASSSVCLSLSIVLFLSQTYKTLSLPFIPTNELWQCKYCRNIWWLRLYCTCISSLINTFNQQLVISVHVMTLKQFLNKFVQTKMRLK